MSYIKLEDAKNTIMNCITEQTVSKYATSAECKAARHGADIALFALDDIPTADVVEVRHGRWLYIDGDVGYFESKCTVCNKRMVFAQEEDIFSYCPNCGAKMDGERRENVKAKNYR